MPREKQDGQRGSQLGDTIAVLGIEGALRGRGNAGFDHPGGIPGEGLGDVTLRVDDTGNAGIGTANDPVAGLDGAEAGIVPMLEMAGGVAPPAVVGNDGNEVGPVPAEFGEEFSIDALVADGGDYLVGSVGRDERGTVALAGIAGGGSAEFLKPGVEEMQEGRKGLDARN